MMYILYILLVIGCFISLLNFYLSFVRYLIFRWRGGSANDYHWISGYPLVGSILVVLSLLLMPASFWLLWFGIVCAVLDTGGLHWFAGTMLVSAVRGPS